MAEPELRRASDPKFVRKIYFGIKKTCEQKQCPTLERIIRALSIDKSQISRSRVEIQLNNAVRDGIIIESNSQGNRGKSVGEMKNSYRIPTLDNFYENYEDDGHDWYCWVCHREGEVYLCSRCPRVIHKKCAELTSEDLTDDFVCYCCKDLESTKQYGKKELQELSTMLSFTVDRMKSKCEELWTSPDEEKEPNYKLFIYKDTNLNDLEKKVKNKEFDSLAKFHYEIEWLFHNAVIFYGGEHKITQLARIVVLDGQSELSQIDICSECYINSNKRPKNWFSKPCKPPHTIVYAKLGSDPPWPAKVLRENETNTSLDVRFFGAPYQRAWIPLKNIWELNNKPPTKKRSKALVQAEEELKIYLRILNAMGDEQDEKPLRSSTSVESDVSSDNDDDDDDSDFDAKGKDSDEEKPKKKRAKFGKVENKAINKRKVGRPRKNEIVEPKKNPRKLKAEERFRQLQESKLKALQKSSAVSHTLVDIKKSDINKNIGKLSSSLSPDSEFAQQIKMTDDYKMIEKLQHQVRNLEKQLEKMKTDYENSQADLEATRLELAAEKQKSKRLQEENDTSNKGHEEDLEKVKNDLLSKKKDDLDSAIEEERQRSELEFKSRLEEAKNEERSKGEVRLQEELEKERAQFEAKVKMKVQHEKDEMQRNFERYKAELEVKHARTLEEENRKKKLEADELYKRTVQRIHLDTERMVAAAKKKSWCSNCNKEAFYHCCWNTNYCSTECQRVHWVAHRYNCTREMMSSTCRSCQQRQNFPPTNFPPQVPPK